MSKQEFVFEIEEAEVITFEPGKNYPILKNFDHTQLLGIAKVEKRKEGLVAVVQSLKIDQPLKAYPAAGFHQQGENKKLLAVGLCHSKNLDETIGKLTLKPMK